MKKFLTLFFLFAIVIPFYGCGRQSAQKIDLNKPIEEVRLEADRMTMAQLKDITQSYADALKLKNEEAKNVLNKMQNVTDAAATEQLTKISNDMQPLFERYQIYLEKYQAKGGDLSQIHLE